MTTIALQFLDSHDCYLILSTIEINGETLTIPAKDHTGEILGFDLALVRGETIERGQIADLRLALSQIADMTGEPAARIRFV
jgi:hypothetical protein